MSGPSVTARNRPLASLPPASLDRLRPKLAPVPLEQRDEIYHADGPIAAVWFPQSGMISLIKLLGDGMQAEIGVIGRERMAGASLLSANATSFSDAMCNCQGPR